MIRLVQTCGGCPEQYDAYCGNIYVGYLRLRHGHFTVQCDGITVYAADTLGDGILDSEERDYHLRFAVAAIQRWINDGDSNRPPAPDIEYKVEYEV